MCQWQNDARRAEISIKLWKEAVWVPALVRGFVMCTQNRKANLWRTNAGIAETEALIVALLVSTPDQDKVLPAAQWRRNSLHVPNKTLRSSPFEEIHSRMSRCCRTSNTEVVASYVAWIMAIERCLCHSHQQGRIRRPKGNWNVIPSGV